MSDNIAASVREYIRDTRRVEIDHDAETATVPLDLLLGVIGSQQHMIREMVRTLDLPPSAVEAYNDWDKALQTLKESGLDVPEMAQHLEGALRG